MSSLYLREKDVVTLDKNGSVFHRNDERNVIHALYFKFIRSVMGIESLLRQIAADSEALRRSRNDFTFSQNQNITHNA